MTLVALELMQDAAQKIENIEQYISNGETPIDENFLFLATTILEELKSHTSDDLLNSVAIIEGDLEVVQGMSVEEILEYFEWNP